MQAHLSYESSGNVTIVKDAISHLPILGKEGEWAFYNNEAKVQSVKFLTPARVTYEIDGKVHTGMAFVNIASKEACHEDGSPHIASDQIFSYLDSASRLPQDLFVASDDIRRQAAEAQDGFKLGE